jgi:hypothetical protein
VTYRGFRVYGVRSYSEQDVTLNALMVVKEEVQPHCSIQEEMI